MTLGERLYRIVPRFAPEAGIFIPLFLILTLIAFVSSIQAYYLAPPDLIALTTLPRILLSKMIYFWYFLFLALVVHWHSKRIALEHHTIIRWIGVHSLTLAISFVVHETLSLGIEKFIWPIESRGTLLYELFNNPAVWIEILMYSLFVLGFSALEFRRSMQENEVKCAQLGTLLVKSRLQELRNRIRPTFLFQTLQTILELIQSGRNNDANHILSLLSDFLRTTVYDADREEIALEEEMRFLNQYLEIEKIRSGLSIRVIEEIPMEAAGSAVPNFIIQPIVDELISRSTEQSGTQHAITIMAKKADEELEVIIEDRCSVSGDGLKTGADRLVILTITRDRLHQLYGENHDLKVCAQSDGVIRVEIRIPLRASIVQSGETLVAETVL